nr:myosin-17 isoform X1 [Tanacetum cinerariifolium]
APRTSREALVKGRSDVNDVAQQTLIAHWQCIVKNIDYHLETMKANFVTPFLVRKVFKQIFWFINFQLFNRMSQILWASRSADKTDGFRQVEARYPALSFKKQLTDLLMNIYGMIRDNLKKELSPFIDLCIQVEYR